MPDATPLPLHNTNCFVCGTQNPCSVGVAFTQVGDRVHAAFHLGSAHEGAPGFVHGGALAAVLDDTLGSLQWVLGRPAVTARLAVDYRRPAFIDRDYTAEAWVDRVEGRKLHFAGVVRDPDGEIVAEAQALFVEVAPEHFQRGQGDELPR